MEKELISVTLFFSKQVKGTSSILITSGIKEILIIAPYISSLVLFVINIFLRKEKEFCLLN